MGRTDQYFKRRRTITERTLKVPGNLPSAPRVTEEIRGDVERLAEETIKKLDEDRYVLRKTTGWLIASLVVTVLFVAAYFGALFFTQLRQVDRIQQQLRQLRADITAAHDGQQRIERRVVELETQLEPLRGQDDQEDE